MGLQLNSFGYINVIANVSIVGDIPITVFQEEGMSNDSFITL